MGAPLHLLPMIERLDIRRRARAAGLHFLISLALAALIAGLVFFLWYPGAYRLLSGGRDLFLLVITVDVILGPLLTFAVFDLRKGWRHLRRDLAVIGLVQLGALAYGLHTVLIARPIAMVFEVDRFRVLNSSEIRLEELPQARPEYRTLPLSGPWLLGARKPRDRAEASDALFKALDGIDIGQRPTFWQPYSESSRDALARSRPVAMLLAHYPERAAELQDRLRALKVDPASARFLPVMARGEWVALLDAAGAVTGFLPADGFF
jgi:hypothetical protein